MEEREKEYLSPCATLSMASRGRKRNEPQCDIRPVFQRDRDRILHSKAFRRMKQKTQVFLLPIGDHYTADAYAGSIAKRPDDRKGAQAERRSGGGNCTGA